VAHDHRFFSRDVLILIVVLLFCLSRVPAFSPSIYGKSTTAAQIILVFTVVLAAAYPNLKLDTFVRVLIYLVAVLSVVSSFHYSSPPPGTPVVPLQKRSEEQIGR